MLHVRDLWRAAPADGFGQHLDATYLKVPRGGRIVSVAAIVAVGMDTLFRANDRSGSRQG